MLLGGIAFVAKRVLWVHLLFRIFRNVSERKWQFSVRQTFEFVPNKSKNKQKVKKENYYKKN